MKTSVALIGFMGVGKTAVGTMLARKLSREFVELDSLIERRAEKSIPAMFKQNGEIAFRELEIEVAKEVAGNKNLVVACGGGVVLNKINIDRLRKESIIVYLTASTEVIIKRVSCGDETRPLLDVTDKVSEIQELLKFRKPFYERAADLKINTSKLCIEAVAEQIIRKLKKNECFYL